MSNGKVNRLADTVFAAIDSLPPDRVNGFVVAYSGGVDSHVLLKCASDWCRARADMSKTTASRVTVDASQPGSISVRAHYIDHALQTDSAQWAVHCESVCTQLQVGFTATRVAIDRQSGYGPEDAARRARYDALKADLRADEVLLLGHHADDQAETLLLQLLRGAGVNGLAGMPLCSEFGPGYLARPMLQVTASDIREYASAQGLEWIEDPSNCDESFDRNLLRHQVIPVLKSRWPSVATSIARSASHCAEAADITRAFAVGVLGEQIADHMLSLRGLSPLSLTEKKAVLRCWIEHHGYPLPSTDKLSHVLTDLVDAADGSAGEIAWGEACVRKYRQHLYLGDPCSFAECEPFCYHWSASAGPLKIRETGQVLTREDIPDTYRNVPGGLVVCSRVQGARLKPAGHRIHKSVKKLYQECSVPPWQRGRLPFVFANGELIGIVGIGFTD